MHVQPRVPPIIRLLLALSDQHRSGLGGPCRVENNFVDVVPALEHLTIMYVVGHDSNHRDEAGCEIGYLLLHYPMYNTGPISPYSPLMHRPPNHGVSFHVQLVP